MLDPSIGRDPFKMPPKTHSCGGVYREPTIDEIRNAIGQYTVDEYKKRGTYARVCAKCGRMLVCCKGIGIRVSTLTTGVLFPKIIDINSKA